MADPGFWSIRFARHFHCFLGSASPRSCNFSGVSWTWLSGLLAAICCLGWQGYFRAWAANSCPSVGFCMTASEQMAALCYTLHHFETGWHLCFCSSLGFATSLPFAEHMEPPVVATDEKSACACEPSATDSYWWSTSTQSSGCSTSDFHNQPLNLSATAVYRTYRRNWALFFHYNILPPPFVFSNQSIVIYLFDAPLWISLYHSTCQYLSSRTCWNPELGRCRSWENHTEVCSPPEASRFLTPRGRSRIHGIPVFHRNWRQMLEMRLYNLCIFVQNGSEFASKAAKYGFYSSTLNFDQNKDSPVLNFWSILAYLSLQNAWSFQYYAHFCLHFLLLDSDWRLSHRLLCRPDIPSYRWHSKNCLNYLCSLWCSQGTYSTPGSDSTVSGSSNTRPNRYPTNLGRSIHQASSTGACWWRNWKCSAAIRNSSQQTPLPDLLLGWSHSLIYLP